MEMMMLQKFLTQINKYAYTFLQLSKKQHIGDVILNPDLILHIKFTSFGMRERITFALHPKSKFRAVGTIRF